MNKHKLYASFGFTLVELIVVIAVVGTLFGLIINSLSNSQERAKIARTQSELSTINRAVVAMSIDTGKWPNGCPVNSISDPHVNIELDVAGLVTEPPIGVVDVGCEWTAYDINNWKGPYLAAEDIVDVWENSYVFDPDYYPFQSCPSETTLALTSALVSYGPDGAEYTCDDIYIEISGQD